MAIVYKTINKVNGHYYIGVHTGNDNAYLGSGKVLLAAVAKYGRSQFERITLFEYECSKKAFEKEAELLTDEVLNSSECYNLKKGGYGGWKFVHDRGLTNKNKTPEHYSKMAKRMHQKMATDPEMRESWLRSLRRGVPRSNEVKDKISQSLKGRKRNKIWITDGVRDIFHNADEKIPEGFTRGRKN